MNESDEQATRKYNPKDISELFRELKRLRREVHDLEKSAQKQPARRPPVSRPTIQAKR